MSNNKISGPKWQYLDRNTKNINLSFPILLKPKTSYGGIGIVKLDNENELLSELNKIEFPSNFFAQEFIVGETICEIRGHG